METVRIIGIDPSLRYTGIAEVIYNTETKKFKVQNCHVIINPAKFKKTLAIMNMLEMVDESAKLCEYSYADKVIVESPAALFNPKFPSGTLLPVSHIAGGAACLFGLSRSFFVRPKEWNKGQRKEKTHLITQQILGSVDDWNYIKRVKNKNHLEHIMDAASMALWYIKDKFMEDDIIPFP